MNEHAYAKAENKEALAKTRDMALPGELSERAREVLCRFADDLCSIAKSKPRYVIIMALRQLGAVQGDAAVMFGMDEGQVSAAMGKIVKQLMPSYGGEVGYAALCATSEPYPEVWCGRHPGVPSAHEPLSDSDREALIALCEGPFNKAAMDVWQQRLLEDEGTLIWVAECLKAKRRRMPPLVPEPVLQGQGTRLQQAVTRAVKRFQPYDFAALLGSSEALMHESVLAKTGADAGTLWLYNDKQNSLEAVFNPTEPEMIGQLQPLRSGLVSHCYKQDLKISVVRASADSPLDERHESFIDLVLGKTTQAMLVVPFYCSGDQRGVLSLVKLKAGAKEFTMADQDTASALCEILARAIERGIEMRVLA